MTSINCPIVIKDDDQELDDIIKQVEQERMKFALAKAHMAGNLEVIFTVMKFQLSKDSSEAENMLREKIRQKFQDIIDIEKDYFYPRKEVNASSEVIKNAIVVYGVDFLSNKNIKPMFEQFSPSIKWLDSSQCKITFPTENDAHEAIHLNIESTTKMEDEGQSLTQWYELKPYEIFTFKRKLWCRYASKEDHSEGDRKSQKYIQFKQRQKQFKDNIFSEYKESYQKYITQLGLSNMHISNTQIYRKNGNSRDQKRGGERNYRDNNYRDNNHRNHYRDGNNYNRDNNYRDRSRDKRRDRYHNDSDNNYRNRRKRSQSFSPEKEVNQSPSNYEYILGGDDNESMRHEQNLDFTQRDISMSISNSNGEANDQRNLDLQMRDEEEDGKHFLPLLTENRKINTSFHSDHDRSYNNKKNGSNAKFREKNVTKSSWNSAKDRSNPHNLSFTSNKSSNNNLNRSSGGKNFKSNQSSQNLHKKSEKYSEKYPEKNSENTKKVSSKDDHWKFQGGKTRSQKEPEKQPEKEPIFDY